MDKLAIRSGAVILKNGCILLDNGELLGQWVKEGEDSEEVCKKKVSEGGIDVELVKLLYPKIKWIVNNNGLKMCYCKFKSSS